MRDDDVTEYGESDIESDSSEWDEDVLHEAH